MNGNKNKLLLSLPIALFYCILKLSEKLCQFRSASVKYVVTLLE